MGENLPQENNIRTSTYCGSDVYDPARKCLKLISYQTLLTFTFILFSLSGFAQTAWMGPAGGDWNTAEHWSNGEVPNANTDVIIPSSSTPIITAPPATAPVCRNLSLYGVLNIAAGATLTVNGNWEIDQVLGGDLTGAGTVILANNAGVANASINLSATLPTHKANFHNLQVNRPSGSLTVLASAVNITNNFTLTSGAFNAGTATIEVGGAFQDGPSATFNSGTSTIKFVGSTSGVQIYGSPAEPFYNVEVAKNNANIQLATSLTIKNDLVINSLPVLPSATVYSMLFSFPGVSLDVQGNLTVNSGGINLSLQDDTYLTVDGSTNIAGGKIFIARSTANSELKLNGGLTISAGSIEVGTSLLTTQSKFSVIGNTIISDDGLLLTNMSTAQFFGDVQLAAPGVVSKFIPFNTNVIVTGNWESDSDEYYTGATSTITLTGSANTFIRGVNRFANVTILKDLDITVTNESELIIDRELLVQTGAFVVKNIPGIDLILNGNLTIANNASLDIADALTNPATRVEIRVGGNITDLNDQEPSTILPVAEQIVGRTYTRRGLYIGMNMENPMGVRGCSSGTYNPAPVQILPAITFTGGNLQIITGRVKLRTYCGGIYSNEEGGIALPNINVNKTNNVVQLNTNTNVRIHGNLIIDRGEFFLNSKALFFGDYEDDEILIRTGGTFHANASSRIFMNTGTTYRGTFLKVDGGALKLIGNSTNPIVITREGTPNQYFRMAAYRGTVEAAYTTISYQGSTNEGFNPDPIGDAAHTNMSNGGFKIYSQAVIDPTNAGYNFSYCTLGANAAGGTTSLTINTGQTLSIEGVTFNTSGSGGINCVNNNNPDNADPARTGVITFVVSRGELGGVNGEAYDGGFNDTDGVIWETFRKIYWIGDTYDTHPNATQWSNPANWSLSPTFPRNNPDNIYPGEFPRIATIGGVSVAADYCQQFEVFICASAQTSPVLDRDIIIQGTVINNAKGRDNAFDLSPVITANHGKTLDLNNYTLEVWGDFVNNSQRRNDADNGWENITGGRINVNPGGRIRFKANFASFHANSVIDVGAGFVLEAIGSAPLQEIKVSNNDLYEFIINKPEGRVVVQGFGNDRLDILGNLNILSGGMELLTNTPMRVDGNFNISGGFFTFNGSSTIIRGNWNNTGGVINTGAGTVNFYPGALDSNPSTATVDPYIIRSNGQAFNVVNFGIISDTRGSLTPATPASPAQTRYLLVDDFTAGGLTTIAARGRISGDGVNDYTDNPVLDVDNPAQPRIVEASAGITVRVNGLRIRENGIFNITPGASVFVSNNRDNFAKTRLNPFNPFIDTGDMVGIRVDGTANTFPNGVMNVIGNVGSYAKVSRNDLSGDYNFKVNGTISARYYFIEWMDAGGVNLTAPTSRAASPGTKNGGSASLPSDCADGSGCENPYVASFSNGVLTNGSTAPNAVYIQYTDNEAVFGNILQSNIPDTVFNASFSKALGIGGVNIRRTGNLCPGATGILWFRDAAGVLAGENFDDDGIACTDDNVGAYPSGLIRWKQPVIKRWDGGMDDGGDPTVGIDNGDGTGRKYSFDWHEPKNWSPDGVPTNIDNVVLDRSLLNSNYQVWIYNGSAEVKDLDIRNDITPTHDPINDPSPIINLILDGNMQLTVNGNFTVKVPSGEADLSKLQMEPASRMIVGGNWDNGGWFTSGTSSIVIMGAGFTGSRVINNVEAPAPAAPLEVVPSARPYNTFYDLELASGTTEIVSHLLIKNNLRVLNGAVLDANAGSFPITIEGNWANAGRFNPQRGLVTFAGNKVQTLAHTAHLNSFENFYDLKIEKRGNKLSVSDSVVLSSRATVANLLNLQNGRFITNETQELIMLIDNIIRRPEAPATTAHVKGPLGHLYSGNGISSRSFYLGDKRYPGVAKLNVALTNPSPRAATVFTMEQIDTDADPSAGDADRALHKPYNYLSKSRHWKVKNIQFPPSTPLGRNADLAYGTVELPFAPDDERIDTTTTDNNVNISRPLTEVLAQVLQAGIVQDSATYTGTVPMSAIRGTAPLGEDWANLGGVLNVNKDANNPDNTGVNPTMTSRVFNRLGNGDFTFAFNFTPLPMELLLFEANKSSQVVNVRWITEKEMDVVRYIVEKSTTGNNFEAIGEMKARGIVMGPQSYYFTDNNLLSATMYYRLRIINRDGSSVYSKVVSVKGNETINPISELIVYPNPFNGRNFSMKSNHVINRQVTIKLYDMLGKVVYDNIITQETDGVIQIDLEHTLQKGIYILQVTTDEITSQKKLIVR